MVTLTNDYGIRVFDHHAKLLRESAICVEVAQQRGYRSVDRRKELGQLGFTSPQQQIPGLLLPVHDETGEIALYQYRPDEPRVHRNTLKVVKYETPSKARMTVDVPPRVREHLGNPNRPLWITEGIRKADAAVSAGLDCLALLGVYNWRGTNDNGGTTALAFWESVALKSRRVYLCFDSDVMLKIEVHTALVRLGAFLSNRGAHVAYAYLPSSDGGKVGLDDYLAAGGKVPDLVLTARSKPIEPPKLARPEVAAPADAAAGEVLDGDVALDCVHAFLARFVAYPSPAAHTAHTLWIAHTHLMAAWESTPRIAFLSPEPGSGKTRALEVSELLVPNPVEAINVTPAYLFRKVGAPEGLPTILFDEIDTVFGPKAKDNEEIRGLLNAGHRRGAVAGRCVVKGKVVETEELPAYCAVALAGIGDLPDTILSRCIVIRMRRRKPTEQVAPYRQRVTAPEGHAIRDALAAWAPHVLTAVTAAWPTMPDEITDRPADVWEPLLAVADAAGGEWPDRARVAAVALVADSKGATPSLGVRLLVDLQTVFGAADAMPTEAILTALTELDEAPWKDLRGKPLDSRGLATRLGKYEIRSTTIRVGDKTPKGYRRSDLHDAWERYLPKATRIPPGGIEGEGDEGLGTPPYESATSATPATNGYGDYPDSPPCGICGHPTDNTGDLCPPCAATTNGHATTAPYTWQHLAPGYDT